MSASIQIREHVVSALSGAADIPVEKLTDDVDLLELGLDSLDFWSMVMDIEDGVGADVPADVLDRLAQMAMPVTVGDLLRVFATWDPYSGAGDSLRPQDEVIVVPEP